MCYGLVWRHLIHPITFSVFLAICLIKNLAITKLLSYNSNDFVPIIDFSNHVWYIYLQICNIIERFQQYLHIYLPLLTCNFQINKTLWLRIIDILFVFVLSPSPVHLVLYHISLFHYTSGGNTEWIYIYIPIF